MMDYYLCGDGLKNCTHTFLLDPAGEMGCSLNFSTGYMEQCVKIQSSTMYSSFMIHAVFFVGSCNCGKAVTMKP
jgi:hypothetical protein